jgi:hypothetical protein
MSGNSAQAAPAPCSGRSASARGVALLVALLVVLLQPRVFAASAGQLGASVSRVVAAHSQRVETNALRAGAAVRVAPPLLYRAPCLPAAPAVRAWPGVRVAAAPARPGQVRQAVSHFHSKRRIPRMNSDEPPRA